MKPFHHSAATEADLDAHRLRVEQEQDYLAKQQAEPCGIIWPHVGYGGFSGVGEKMWHGRVAYCDGGPGCRAERTRRRVQR